MTPAQMKHGDVLLYRGTGLYGRLIALKTWHPVGHVEISLGGGRSVASRDGKGVGEYDHRAKDLYAVLRPNVPFDAAAARRFFRKWQGTLYGWLDLLNFIGMNVDANGIVCSPFATRYLRAGGVPVFNTEPAEKIAPFQFLLSELLDQIWSAEDAAINERAGI